MIATDQGTNRGELVHEADGLRNATTALEPDARARTTVTIRADGSVSMLALEDQHAAVSRFELTLAVPLDIRVHFETAKNLYLYAWFVYRFYPVAEQQALATLEFALRERLAPLFPDQFGPSAKRSPGLRALIEKASKEKLIRNAGLRANERLARNRARQRASMERIREMQARGLSEMQFDRSAIEPLPEDYAHDSLRIFAETVPFFRNTYAHGSSMLHSTVLGTFEVVTDLVNQLYVSNSLLNE